MRFDRHDLDFNFEWVEMFHALFGQEPRLIVRLIHLRALESRC